MSSRTPPAAASARAAPADREIEQVRASEIRFRALVEHASDMLAIVAPDGTTVYESPSNIHHLGWTPGELVGSSAFDRVHPEDVERVAAALERLLAKPGAPIEVEYRYRHKDGGWRVLSSIGTNLVHEPAVGGIVVSSRDVTAQRATEAQLRQAQTMQAIGRLAGGIAHDFNNLLAAIKLHTEILLAGRLDEKALRAGLSDIVGVIDRAAALTDQLLAVSQRRAIAPRVLDLNEVVGGLTALLRRVLPSNIAIDVRLDPALAPVRADPTQLEQVLLNLAVNARDAMPEGGTLRIETANLPSMDGDDGDIAPKAAGGAPEPAGPGITLVVSDTGHGMTAEVRERLFEPFFTTRPPGVGTGLGLSIVYGIVTRAGGRTSVESAPGAGTTIRIVLPAADLPR